MSKEIENELPELSLNDPLFWEKASKGWIDNPKMVLPVYLEDPETKERVGDFYFSFVTEKGRTYMQADGFSTDILETAFVTSSSLEWIRIQKGIYRIDVTDVDSRLN